MVNEIQKGYLATGEEKALEIAGLSTDPNIRIVSGEAKGEFSSGEGITSGRGAYRHLERNSSIKGTMIDEQGSRREVKVSNKGWPVINVTGERDFELASPWFGRRNPTIFFYGRHDDKYDYVEFEATHGRDRVKRDNVAIGGFLLESNHNYNLEKILFSPESTFEIFSEAFKDDPEQLDHHRDVITSESRVIVNLNYKKMIKIIK